MNQDKVQQLVEGNRAGLAASTQRPSPRRAENVLVIPVERFRHTPNNARKSMNEDELTALADNLRRNGQIQNVVAWLDEATGNMKSSAAIGGWPPRLWPG